MGIVLWYVETFKIFRISPVCVSSALWCVGTLKIYKTTLCMGAVLWCDNLENVKIIKNFLVCGLCTGEIIFEKPLEVSLLYWRLKHFSSKKGW